jgi:hypothetical protein
MKLILAADVLAHYPQGTCPHCNIRSSDSEFDSIYHFESTKGDPHSVVILYKVCGPCYGKFQKRGLSQQHHKRLNKLFDDWLHDVAMDVLLEFKGAKA